MRKDIAWDTGRKTGDSKVDWSKVFSRMGDIIRALIEGLLKLIFMPIKAFAWAAHYNTRRAAENEAESESQGDEISRLEAALEKTLTTKSAPKTAPPAKHHVPYKIVGAALREIAAGRQADISVTDLDPAWQAWLDNLSQDQATEALKESVASVLLHLRGQTVLPGLPPRLSAGQERELFEAIKLAEQRFRRPQRTADELPEFACPRF